MIFSQYIYILAAQPATSSTAGEKEETVSSERVPNFAAVERQHPSGSGTGTTREISSSSTGSVSMMRVAATLAGEALTSQSVLLSVSLESTNKV